jgi:hypothetical protein
MELIQIIESTVFIFSLGLLVLLILSYLLFKVKNRSVIFPRENLFRSDEVKILYEIPELPDTRIDEPAARIGERFVVVNEIMNKEDHDAKFTGIKNKVNPRFYIYQPGRNKIVTNLQLSRIKE